MPTWTLERKDLPLRVVWKIARGSLESKLAFFLTLSCDGFQGRGEVSPNTRYGNTPEVIERDFLKLQEASASEPGLGSFSLVEYGRWLDALGICRTLRFGAESAWVHLQAQKRGCLVTEVLGLSPVSSANTCFSVPIMEPGELEAYLRPLARFQSLKIKVDAASGVATLKEVAARTSQKLRIDGNEAWTDPAEFLRFVEGLRGMNIEFIEQPLPAGAKQAYREILPRMPYPLLADESIVDEADFDDLKTQFSGVNVKLMKTGGYVRAIELLQGARAHGMKTMLGCMVETSLGISSALHLTSLVDYVDLDGFLLLKEDPFGLVSEKDGALSFQCDAARGG